MRLDHELVRDLILEIEDRTDGIRCDSFYYYEQQFPDIAATVVDYHLRYLIDAGYVRGAKPCAVVDLTPAGHNFAESVRDQIVWGNTKKALHPLEGVSLDVITEVAKSSALKLLGLG